jgi:transcriptional regulator
MYTPPMFKPDRAASLHFAEARGFGTACAWDGRRPVASALPFYLEAAADGTPHAMFHVARNNPLIRAADNATPWVLAVNGADAYISPDWCVSADQVPTWLYQVVHLTGPVRTLSEAELVVQIDTLSAKFESRLLPKKPWTSSKMTTARLEALKKGIVGLAMRVDEVEGSFKLSQHKSQADYAAMANVLGAMPDQGSQTIARLMRETRPQAFAANPDNNASLEGSL